jgi:hypothetical protein
VVCEVASYPPAVPVQFSVVRHAAASSHGLHSPKQAASTIFISSPKARYRDRFLVGIFCLSRKCDSSAK